MVPPRSIRLCFACLVPLSSLLVVSCGVPRPEAVVEEHHQPQIATNQIATNQIATNALTTNQIATNALASSALAGAFPAGALQGVVTDFKVRTNLEDPDAQMLMSYLVGCALDPGQSLQWTSRFSPTTRTWQGDLGLCPQWLTSAPSAQCLERVSACLLARNNVFGVSVPLSLRGNHDGVDAISLAPEVGLWPKLWRTSTDVPSAQPCGAGESGLSRNCGWQSVGVGRCTPGQPVVVGAGGCGLGSSVQNTMLRICTRMHFCDDGSDELIAQNDDACDTEKPSVSFTCPQGGFYAVMAANHLSAEGPAQVQVQADPPLLPSSEGEVFGWREGAFYGNIFDPVGLNPLKRQVRVNPNSGQVEEQLLPGFNWWIPGKTLSSLFTGVVFRKMWACSSDNWSLVDAYYQRRVCAGLGGLNCAAQYAGPCNLLCEHRDSPPVSGDGDYGNCADLTLHRWQSPMTPFLNNPCDLLPLDVLGIPLDDVLCSTVAALPLPL
jgi:hypothetical protein